MGLFLTFILIFSMPCFGQLQKINTSYRTNGSNTTALEKGGILYVGGAFSEVGRANNGLAVIDTVTGKLIPNSTLKCDMSIFCAIEDGSGGYYVGGEFNYINDTLMPTLVHIKKDGAVDLTFKFRIVTQYSTGGVNKLVRMGDTLFCLGNFDSANGLTRKNLCAINIKTKEILNWNPKVSAVNAIDFNADYIFISGVFTSYDNHKVMNFVQLNRKDFSYMYTPGYVGEVKSLVWDSGRIVAKGNFSGYGWGNQGLLMIDTADLRKASWSYQMNGYVTRIVKSPAGDYYLAGEFTLDGYPSIVNLMKLKPNLTLDTGFKFKCVGKINDMALIDSFLYCAGDAITINGKLYLKLGIINYYTQKLGEDKFYSQASIISLETYKNNLIAKTYLELLRVKTPEMTVLDAPLGDVDAHVDSCYLYFTRLDGYSSIGDANVVVFESTGKFNHTLSKQYLSTCNDLVPDEKGGWFMVGNGIMHVLADGSLDPKLSFSFQSGAAESVLKIGDSLYVGGSFQNIYLYNSSNRVVVGNLAIINIKTGNVESFQSTINKQLPNYYNTGNVKRMRVVGDSLVMLGIINTTGTSPYKSFGNILKMNIKTGGYSNTAANFDNIMSDVYADDSFIYYGGIYKNVNNISRKGICRINRYTNKLDHWKPAFLDSTTAHYYRITGDDSFIYTAMRTYSNNNNYVVRISKRTGLRVPFGNNLDSFINPNNTMAITAVKVIKDTLFVAGDFTININGTNYTNMLRYNLKTGVANNFKPKIAGTVLYIEPLKNGKIILGGNVNDIDRRNNELIARYDMDKNQLDSWKVNYYSSGKIYGKVTFCINKKHIYIAHRAFNNTTIDGITRTTLFEVNKADGKATSFDSKIPYTGYDVTGLEVVNKSVYLLQNEYSVYNLYKVTEGKSGSYEKVNLSAGQSVGLRKGINSSVFITGTLGVYAYASGAIAYLPYTRDFRLGMNNYPGTTPGNLGSSVFYNWKDSIYYLYEPFNANHLNIPGLVGNYYRVNAKTKQVRKLDFSNTGGIAGILKQDSILYLFGNFTVINSKGNTNYPMYHVFKFNENKNTLLPSFYPHPNQEITGVLPLKNNLLITGKMTILNTQFRKVICAIDIKADTITNFAPDPNGNVSNIIGYDTALIISGDFSSTKFGTLGRLGIINAKNGKTIYNINTTASFSTIHLNQNKLYLGGSFSNYAGTGINNLVRYNLKTKQVETWNPKISGKVISIASDDSFIYAVGDITKSGNSTQNYLAKVRIDDGANVPLGFKLKAPNGGSDWDGTLYSVFLTENLAYISGDFEYDNKRKGIMAFNKKTNNPSPFYADISTYNLDVIGPVARIDDKILVVSKNAINGIGNNDLQLIDRYQPITYPNIFKQKYVIPSVSAKMLSSESYVYFPSGFNFKVNSCTIGNIMWMEKDTQKTQKEVFTFLPQTCANSGKVTLRIKGKGFDENSKVFIRRKNKTIAATQVISVDRNLLLADFAFNKDSLGQYTLSVIFGAGDTITADSVLLLQTPDTVNIETKITGYEQIRPGRWYDYFVRVENKTNANLQNVPVFFSIQSFGKAQVEAVNVYADTFIYAIADTVFSKNLQSRVYAFLMPEMRAKESYNIPVSIKASGRDSVVLQAWNHLPVDNARKRKCIQQLWGKFSGTTTATKCLLNAFNTADSLGISKQDYEFGNATAVADYNRLFKNARLTCNNNYTQTYLNKLNKYYANPVYLSGLDSVCISHNGVSADSAIILKKAGYRYKLRIINSLDPNDKLGPLGTNVGGNNLFTDLPSEFDYTIRFENDSTATAPAQTVVVHDTIDTRYFDIHSVNFTSFKVGSFKYYFPPETNVINRNFDFRTQNVILNLSTQLDTIKGIVTWTFKSLDILSLSEDKLNPVYGFLPPNNYTNRGQGAVAFSIKLRKGIAKDVNIKNRANIVFDDNKSILTPYWSVIKDNVPPISKVLPLSPTTTNSNFTVTWKGTDVSGLKTINVFASSNNVVYALWKQSLKDSAAVYAGKKDTTYYFYSIAVDKLGNTELKPDSFDAKTKVSQIQNVSVLNNGNYRIFPNPGTGVVNIEIENAGNVNMEVYDIQGRLIEDFKKADGHIQLYFAKKGVYIVKINNNDKLIGVEKLIIE